jgi:lipopolysaccharide/colanic/teichoic acid biosynthesis glycosyltransferase
MYKYFFKRLLDIVLSLFGLVILSPVFIIVTVFLFFANKGKPFFSQTRPGKDERIFKIIKFKTMNDKKGENGNLLPDKERLTKVGAFVRKMSLDEIPQLLNVIKGEMSLIGPRPLLIEYLPYYTDIERKRHEVRPGITGYAQVNGRNQLNWDQRLELDILYIQNLSFIGDVKIFIKTVVNVLKRTDVLVIPSDKLNRLDYVRKNNN